LTNSAAPEFQLAVILFVLINSFVLVCWPLQVSRSLLSSPLQVIIICYVSYFNCNTVYF
jgi:hypothetical protein